MPCNGAISEPTVQQEDSEVRVASLDPAQRSVSTINITAPVPMMRPGAEPTDEGDDAIAAGAPLDPNTIMPVAKPPAMMVATRGALPIDGRHRARRHRQHAADQNSLPRSRRRAS